MASRGVGNCMVKKEEGLSYASTDGRCHEEAQGGLSGCRATCVVSWWSIIGFFWLVLSCKWGPKIREAVSYWSVIVGRLLQRLWFNFLDWLLQKLSVTVFFLFLSMVWLSVCLLSFSRVWVTHNNLTAWILESDRLAFKWMPQVCNLRQVTLSL